MDGIVPFITLSSLFYNLFITFLNNMSLLNYSDSSIAFAKRSKSEE